MVSGVKVRSPVTSQVLSASWGANVIEGDVVTRYVFAVVAYPPAVAFKAIFTSVFVVRVVTSPARTGQVAEILRGTVCDYGLSSSETSTPVKLLTVMPVIVRLSNASNSTVSVSRLPIAVKPLLLV